MSTLARSSAALRNWAAPVDETAELSRLEARLPALLSVIAGMVDLTGFFTWAIFSPPMSPAILWLLPLRRCMAVRSIRRKSWLFPSLCWPWRPFG